MANRTIRHKLESGTELRIRLDSNGLTIDIEGRKGYLVLDQFQDHSPKVHLFDELDVMIGDSIDFPQ